jgi:hypothetical protein
VSLVLLERKLLKFHFKEVTSLYLAYFYVVLLPKCCLVLLVVVLALVVDIDQDSLSYLLVFYLN